MDFSKFFKFQDGTTETATDGGLFVVEKIFYFLFKSPFVLWRMSCNHLKGMRAEAKLDIEKINEPLPFIAFLIRYFIDFLLHALIFLAVVLAPVIALIVTITGIIDGINAGHYQLSTLAYDFLGTLAISYYAPILFRLLIEFIAILRKYSLIILKYIFLPILIVYHFFSYLASKCKYKTEKYEKQITDLNKE